MKYAYRYSSKMGNITLLSNGTYLIGISFEVDKYTDYRQEKHPSFDECIRWLDIYFGGGIPDFIPALKYNTTPFRKEVWNILLKIPYGKTRTYKEIAMKKGIKKMSAQAIGTACGYNDFPIIIPCHRVIGSHNNLFNYTGGSDKKIFLLNLEGISLSKKDMKKVKSKIGDIPVIVWGENSSKIFIAMHGNMSNKEDEVISIFADVVIQKGYQLISFDLPEHGERKDNHEYLCNAQNCIADLEKVYNYVANYYGDISIWACSMSAYFSLIGLKDKKIQKAVFLSPVIDMYELIKKMMSWANVKEEELKDKKIINTSFGTVLYWDYYSFVKNNTVNKWEVSTDIICGDKDDMQDNSSLTKFVNDRNFHLYTLKDGEHYFHTKLHLDYYRIYLEEIFK